jgi:hypothetical protein
MGVTPRTLELVALADPVSTRHPRARPLAGEVVLRQLVVPLDPGEQRTVVARERIVDEHSKEVDHGDAEQSAPRLEGSVHVGRQVQR